VWEEALRRNIKMEQLVVFGSYTELYRAHIADRWEYFESIPVPAWLESGKASLIDDKFLIKMHLRTNGVPTPRTISVRTESEALSAFRELGTTAAVKPRAGSRGRHTTTNIRREEELLIAFRLAKKLCRYVAIEEHLSGSVCRATLVGGTLAGFLQADPPRVVGDGHRTIRELVAERNTERPDRVQEIVLGEEHERFLARQGYSLDSIPSTGVRIDLTHRTGRLFGGETRELLDTVHPKMRAYLERAAQLLQAPVVGLDLIIEDPESDPDTQRWGIIEANSLPYIDLHYLPLHGAPSNVASAVWDLWEKPTL
jgi:cyanophycin synthetase